MYCTSLSMMIGHFTPIGPANPTLAPVTSSTVLKSASSTLNEPVNFESLVSETSLSPLTITAYGLLSQR